MKNYSIKGYPATADQYELFKSGKLSGCQRAIFRLIDKLRFSREMRSLELWKSAEAEAANFCSALAENRQLHTWEARILRDFILRHGKGRP